MAAQAIRLGCAGYVRDGIPKIVAYLSCSAGRTHFPRTNYQDSGLPKLLRWSHAFCLDQFIFVAGCGWYDKVICDGETVKDLHRWWFLSTCSSGKLSVVSRSWAAVRGDPRFKRP